MKIFWVMIILLLSGCVTPNPDLSNLVGRARFKDEYVTMRNNDFDLLLQWANKGLECVR